MQTSVLENFGHPRALQRAKADIDEYAEICFGAFWPPKGPSASKNRYRRIYRNLFWAILDIPRALQRAKTDIDEYTKGLAPLLVDHIKGLAPLLVDHIKGLAPLWVDHKRGSAPLLVDHIWGVLQGVCPTFGGSSEITKT